MPWYKTGTAAFTNGSTAVVGTGTDWIGGASVGEAVIGPDGRFYEIATIASATTLTITPAYLGTNVTGAAYTIAPTQAYIRQLASEVAALVNQYATVANGTGQGKFPDGTVTAPGIRFTADENTGLRRLSSDTMALVAGGVDIVTISPSGIFAASLTTALNAKADLSGATFTGNAAAPRLNATTGFAISGDTTDFATGSGSVPNYGIGYLTGTSETVISGFGGVRFYTGHTLRCSLNGSGNATFAGNVTVGGGTLGYGAGSGGTVTQATSKSAAVALNKPSGQITTHNESIPAGESRSFTCFSSAVTNDPITANLLLGFGNPNSYRCEVIQTSTGGFSIRLTNISGGALAEALVIQYNIIKGSTT